MGVHGPGHKGSQTSSCKKGRRTEKREIKLPRFGAHQSRVICQLFSFGSPVSDKREFIATADPTLASFRAGLFVGDENGCSILARPGAAWRPKPHGWSVVAGKVPIVPGHGRTELCIVAELCKPLQDLPHACPGVQGETMLPSIHMQHLRLQTPVKKGLKSCRKKPEGEWEQAFLPGP